VFNGDDFKSRMYKVYDGYFDKMPVDYHYQIIHITYFRFFSDDYSDDWCNSQSFGYWPGDKPLLSKDLRQKLNKLSDESDDRLRAIVWDYIGNKDPYLPDHAPGWEWNRLFTLRPDRSFAHRPFDGHRFCEPGDRDKDFGQDNTYIFGMYGSQNNKAGTPTVDASYFSQFDPATCGSDPQYQANESYSWDCDISIGLTSPQAQAEKGNLTLYAGEIHIKAFHPKSIGFTAIKDKLNEYIDDIRPPGGPELGSSNCVTMPNIAFLGEGTTSTLYPAATSCASSTDPPSPTVTNVVPVSPPSKLQCPIAPLQKPRDAHAPEMSKAAGYFCSKYASATATSPPPHVTQSIISGSHQEGRATIDTARDYTGNKVHDDVYVISVDAVDGCANDSYNLATPIPGDKDNTCAKILGSAWHQCKLYLKPPMRDLD